MDLQKVYDSIWREELRFKQEKVGLKRMFLDINSMYTLWTFFADLQKSGHETTLYNCSSQTRRRTEYNIF